MTPETIFNVDAWVIAFLAKNIITTGIILKVLKEVAKATPWALDDSILQIVTGLIKKKD